MSLFFFFFGIGQFGAGLLMQVVLVWVSFYYGSTWHADSAAYAPDVEMAVGLLSLIVAALFREESGDE